MCSWKNPAVDRERRRPQTVLYAAYAARKILSRTRLPRGRTVPISHQVMEEKSPMRSLCMAMASTVQRLGLIIEVQKGQDGVDDVRIFFHGHSSSKPAYRFISSSCQTSRAYSRKMRFWTLPLNGKISGEKS